MAAGEAMARRRPDLVVAASDFPSGLGIAHPKIRWPALPPLHPKFPRSAPSFFLLDTQSTVSLSLSLIFLFFSTCGGGGAWWWRRRQDGGGGGGGRMVVGWQRRHVVVVVVVAAVATRGGGSDGRMAGGGGAGVGGEISPDTN
jgi:hypothetical protein